MSDAEGFRYYIERQNLAYAGPTGTWAQRWIPGVCKHSEVRCTHGDEIIGRRWRRRVCLICGRALRGPLPRMCFFAEQPHASPPVTEAPKETNHG